MDGIKDIYKPVTWKNWLFLWTGECFLFLFYILATLVSLHYNINKNRMKLYTFKISYPNYRKTWQKLVLMNTFCV